MKKFVLVFHDLYFRLKKVNATKPRQTSFCVCVFVFVDKFNIIFWRKSRSVGHGEQLINLEPPYLFVTVRTSV